MLRQREACEALDSLGALLLMSLSAVEQSVRHLIYF